METPDKPWSIFSTTESAATVTVQSTARISTEPVLPLPAHCRADARDQQGLRIAVQRQRIVFRTAIDRDCANIAVYNNGIACTGHRQGGCLHAGQVNRTVRSCNLDIVRRAIEVYRAALARDDKRIGSGIGRKANFRRARRINGQEGQGSPVRCAQRGLLRTLEYHPVAGGDGIQRDVRCRPPHRSDRRGSRYPKARFAAWK